MDVCLSTDHELAKRQNFITFHQVNVDRVFIHQVHRRGPVLTTLPIGMLAIPEMGGLCVHVCEIEYCMSVK